MNNIRLEFSLITFANFNKILNKNIFIYLPISKLVFINTKNY